MEWVRGVVCGTVAELAGAVVALEQLDGAALVVALAGFGYFPAPAVGARALESGGCSGAW